ncbi:hypothetical protein ABKV19_006930 [Rosa sericea]
MTRDSTLVKGASLVRHLEKKLAFAKGKLKKAEKALAKVQEKLDPADLPDDLEILTDEDRFLFRKIGLSMKPFLLLGRREVYSGTIENMHLHWKHRELVKIIGLKHHLSDLQERIELLKSELEEMENGRMVDDGRTLRSTLDDSLFSSDSEEDEGEEAYLEVYDSGNEDNCDEHEVVEPV